MTTKFVRVEISYTMEISSDNVPALAQVDDSEEIWANDYLRETLINLTKEKGKFEVTFPEFWSED